MVAFLQKQDQSLPLVYLDGEFGDFVVGEAELSLSSAPSPDDGTDLKDYKVIRIN
jgi:hypothetical protein